MRAVNPTSTSQDLLGDLDQVVVLNYASKGERFGNYFIDSIIVFVLNLGVTTILMLLIDLAGGDDEMLDRWPGYVLSFTVCLIYYFLMEGYVQGRTLGKMVTGTYTIGNNGQPLTLQQAFYRSLCRLVPIEPFSGFGSAPWHDKWTETTVVKKNK